MCVGVCGGVCVCVCVFGANIRTQKQPIIGVHVTDQTPAILRAVHAPTPRSQIPDPVSPLLPHAM